MKPLTGISLFSGAVASRLLNMCSSWLYLIFTHWAKSEKWVMIARYLVNRSIYVTKNSLYAGLGGRSIHGQRGWHFFNLSTSRAKALSYSFT